MEIKAELREYTVEGIEGLKFREYTTIATEETLPTLKLYAQFGNERRMRVGDTVQIRDEHVERKDDVLTFTARPADSSAAR